MSERFIYLIKPIEFLIPEVPKPTTPLKKKEKIVWTMMVLFIFLIMSEIPLYGTYKTEESNSFQAIRVIFSSNQGSLMELGTSPVYSANLLFHFFVALRLVDVDYSIREDYIRTEQTKKLLAILIAFGESIAFVFSGKYGEISIIGIGTAILLVAQLFIAGILVILLEDVLDNGYGISSGISLYLATNISQVIIMKTLSPITINNDNGFDYEGSIISAIYSLITEKNKKKALKRAFFRKNSPNFLNLLSTVFIFLIVIYLHGFRDEIKINSKHQPGIYITKKIKLFYCSNTPIIIQGLLFSNIYFLSQILYRRYGQYFIIRLIGQWDIIDGRDVAVGGLAYYISPPNDFTDFIKHPLKSFCYTAFIIITSGVFAMGWTEMGGNSGRDLAHLFKEDGFFLEGIRENEQSIYERLNTRIPAAAFLGGAIIGILEIIADLTGAIGSGTGILLLVEIIYSLQKHLSSEDPLYDVSTYKLD